ncbi:MAG TPA: PAS domain-containing protein, partial [Opitutaceae bacterium]|nr:PAS domain-containing protein [Opitutaceae bacterium]
GVQFDISDRKELEEEALGAQERLLRLSRSGFLGCFDLDFIKQSFWFSSAWNTLFGLPANDVSRLHEPLWPLLDTLPSEAVDTGVRSWLETHRPESEPLIEAIMLRHQDGRGIPVLLGLSRHFSRKGELLHVVGFALPLNSDAVSALSGRPLPPAHLVAATIDSLSEAILIADAQGNVVYLNARAERLLGNPEAANGTTKIAQAFPLVHRSDYQPAHDAVGIHLASDTPNALCAEHALAPRPDRSEPLPIVWSARKTLDSEGHVSGVVIVFRDPREMSLTPEELIRTNRLETLGHLASGIASDYNNLLTTILGAISQAKEHQDFSHLTNAEKACLDAKGLSRQLLSFSRQSPSAGTSTCSANDLLRDAARLATMGCPASLRLELPDD